jgi:ABC-type lipoprotein release transport system permease subunit
MKFIFSLAFRNLIRQKRRNILLGIAICLGVSILIVADSFSDGISDILFNKIIVRVSGHVSVNFWEQGSTNRQIFRDKDKVMQIIKKSLDENFLEMDESIGVFGRALGNGKADNTVLVGINKDKKVSEKTQKEMEESFKMIEGSFDDLSNKNIENPIILSDEKAKYLNLKKGDVLRLKFQNIYGQNQASRLTIVGIMRNSNIFMQGVIFCELQNVKKIMGYNENEIGALSINVKNPTENAVKLADKLHAMLESKTKIAMIDAKINDKAVAVFGLKVDDKSKNLAKKIIKIKDGDLDFVLSNKGVLISENLAKDLNLKIDDEIILTYQNKFPNVSMNNVINSSQTEVNAIVKGIFIPDSEIADNYIFFNEKKFYDFYYLNLPREFEIKSIEKNINFSKILATNWIVLPRTKTTDDYQKKVKNVGKKKWKGTVIDVSTMYETASDVLKLEGVLKLITLVAVLILFFIILIGVVNTLRMSIRERTREIGTIRAIGMQRKQVVQMFVCEIFYLTLISSFFGTILAFVSMALLKLIKFNMTDNPLGILLLNERLYFLTRISDIALNIFIIMVIALFTAYFPAKRAANMSSVEALRYYE